MATAANQHHHLDTIPLSHPSKHSAFQMNASQQKYAVQIYLFVHTNNMPIRKLEVTTKIKKFTVCETYTAIAYY